MSCELRLENLIKEFQSKEGVVRAVDGVSLDFEPGAFVTLLGPSGCGKTTVLRMIAGLESPTSGEIYLDGKSVTRVPPNQRETAMVFQSYALFPHLTVFENVAYGLRLRKLPENQIKAEVEEKLELMGLTKMANRSPNQLSGGQQQRVALARALVMSPKVLLFDEPLSNLDAKLRVQVREEIRRLQRQLGVTTVYVTHDQDEAMAISDLVVIMNQGRVEQAGTPEQIYHDPKTPFVADFIGQVNLLAGTMSEDAHVTLLDNRLAIRNPYGLPAGPVQVAIRPEAVTVGSGPWTATVERSIFLGAVTEYTLAIGDVKVVASVHGRRARLAEGETTQVGFEADALLALAP